MGVIAELERGRQSYARESWRDAFESLSNADQAAPLGPEDLELLARAQIASNLAARQVSWDGAEALARMAEEPGAYRRTRAELVWN